MIPREECLDVLLRHRGDAIVITTMSVAIPWQQRTNSDFDVPSVGSAMGHAADFGLGLALAQPDRPVWCLNGDGSMLMTLETLITIRRSPAPNYRLFVFQNDEYEVTGNQPTPGAGLISFPDMARAAGWSSVHEFTTLEALDSGITSALADAGPVFINLHMEAGHEGPPGRTGPLSRVIRELRAALGKTD